MARRREDPPKNRLARAVWEFRLRLNLTQEKFAAKAKIARETVADWERNAANPDGESIDKILKAFPEARQILSPFDGPHVSDPGARLVLIRRSLEEALARHADKFTGPQALAIRSEIDDLSARIHSGGSVDTTEADIIIDLLARILGPTGRGDRG